MRFAPRWYWTALTLLAVAGFVSLGFWQWHRGEYRKAQWEQFARADLPAVEATADSLDELPRFTRVATSGVFDAERQFLLDNISHGGAPGYEVLSLLKLADGSYLMVNRGWVPFSGYRDVLPDIRLQAQEPVRITGRLSTLPVAGMASGQQPPSMDAAWPRVTSFPTPAQLQQVLGVRLREPVLLLDADSGSGYLRDWQPPGVQPERNFSYAVQWWSFALLALGMFTGFNVKRSNV